MTIRRDHSGWNPRETPNYGLSEAAHYLRVPVSTLRAWALGRPGQFEPVFDLAKKTPPTLSFYNLVEAHVLAAIRRHVAFNKIRTALHYIQQDLRVERPLINKRFQTDGVHLFVEHFGKLLNVSRPAIGQVEMSDLLQAYLKRIEFDRDGLAVRLYPFTRDSSGGGADAPRSVVFDPAVSFGRLVVAGTGVTTAAIADRFAAGDAIDDLSLEFSIDRGAVEEAIRCESLPMAA